MTSVPLVAAVAPRGAGRRAACHDGARAGACAAAAVVRGVADSLTTVQIDVN